MKIRTTLAGIFPAMTESNFRLYFNGQLISFAGSWLQNATMGWLIVTVLHGSAADVGFVAFLSLVPAVALTFFAGVIVDGINVRTLLYFTNTAAIIPALVLGYHTYEGTVTLSEVKLLAVLSGLINALDSPARQTLMINASRNHRRSGAAINTSMVMLGQVIGGLLAGIFIPIVGIAGSFLVNGLSFIAVIVTVKKMRFAPNEERIAKAERPLVAMRSGIQYLWKERMMLAKVMITGVTVIVGFSHRSIFPVVTEEMFHAGPHMLGWLYASLSIGALGASVTTSALSKRLAWDTTLFRCFAIGGIVATGIALVLFSMTGSHRAEWASFPLLMIGGAGLILNVSSLRGDVIHAIREDMRGRVLGFILMIFFGSMAAGSWLAGVTAHHLGCAMTIRLLGLSSIAFGLLLFVFKSKFVPTGDGSSRAIEV